MNDAVYKFKRYEDASLIYTGIDRHAGENIGLFSTVISKEDYDRMRGVLIESMSVDDDFYAGMAMPSETVIDSSSDDEPDYVIKTPVKKEKPSGRKPLVADHVPMASLGPTYRPSYVPPSAAKPVAKPENVVKVDTSSVKVGTVVKHKAFGEGTVVKINGNYIEVSFPEFGSKPKQFQFPGAFTSGFLQM